MTWLLAIPAGWFIVGLAISAYVADKRHAVTRLGPFPAPNGTTCWIMPRDPLADVFGTGDHGTTFSRTIGLADAETTRGVDGPFLAHECLHIRQQRWLGPLSVPMVAPLYPLFAWMGHDSPLEVSAYADQARVAALSASDPERQAWDALAVTVNRALGA